MRVLPVNLCVVMPCFNEEAGISKTVNAVAAKLRALQAAGLITESSGMLFVDDGSSDDTWNSLCKAYADDDAPVQAIRFAGNRGKEYALLAGVEQARLSAEVIVCMDADLQFDINAIDDFLKLYAEGYDLVYGVKRNRGKERFYKTVAARCFYSLMAKLGSPVIRNHTDYCLFTRQVAEALSEYGETNVIFRGIIKSLGFRQTACDFDVLDREDGESHFSVRKLVNLSLDAITSFSIAPLRLIGGVGFAVLLVGVVMIFWTIIDALRGMTPSGYATLNCSLWFIGGLVMLSLATVGEYIGKLYMEAKKRPRYTIAERIGFSAFHDGDINEEFSQVIKKNR